MNKDEAIKCFQLAESYYQNGDYAQAKKLFLKSNRLNPNNHANEYISKCINQMSNNANKENNINEQQNSHLNGARKKSQETKTEDNSTPNYTKQQLEIVNKIKRLKDFYEILNVPKTAQEDEIKKAYKKLAIKLHPDKNRAPGAIDSFKKVYQHNQYSLQVAQAYDCLVNSDKRATYDRYGDEDPDAHQQHYYQYYSQDVQPEDLFDFIFGSYQNRYQQRRQRQHQNPEQQARNQRGSLLQFLPLIVIFLSTIFYNLAQADPPISFTLTYKYNLKKYTDNLQIQYFVDKNFYENFGKYPQKLQDVYLYKLENEIESASLDQLYAQCAYNKQRQNQLYQQANFYSGKDRDYLQRQAKKVSLEPCENYNNLKTKIEYVRARQYIN